MSKYKIATPIALTALFMGCFGPEADVTAPKLKSNFDNLTVSVFDTLKLEFDEAIQAPKSENIIQSGSDLAFSWDAGQPTILKIYGRSSYMDLNKAPAQLPSDQDFVLKLSGLKGQDGNDISDTEVRFRTAILADSDFVSSPTRNNNVMANADSIMSGGQFLGGNASLFSGILAAGLKEFESGLDEVDHYRLQLKMNDTLLVELRSPSLKSGNSCKNSLKLELKGPLVPGTKTLVQTDTATQQGDCSLALKVAVRADRQLAGFASDTLAAGTLLDYWLQVSFRTGNEGTPAPYTMNVRRKVKL